MSSSDASFPLDTARLPRLLVGEEAMNDWATAANAEVGNVIQNLDSWYFRTDEFKGSFKLAYEREPLLGFTRANPHIADKNDFLCQGTLQLSFDDIPFALHSKTTFEFRSAQVQLYPDSFLDAAVLRMAEGPTSDDPFRFVGVKWEAHGSAGSGLATARDYLYFECLSKTRDAHGREVVVQYVESLELPAHQLQDHGIRMTRAATFAINTFRPDPVHGGVLYQSAGSVGVSKNVPSWAGAVKGLPHSLRSIPNLSALVDVRTIFSLGVPKKLLKQPYRQEASENKMCIVCERKFHMLTRSRHKCHACGRCACRSCTVALKFFNQANVHSSRDHYHPVLSERFCIKCVMNFREQRRSGAFESQSCSGNLIGSASVSSDATIDSCFADEAPVHDLSREKKLTDMPEINDKHLAATKQTRTDAASDILLSEYKTTESATLTVPVTFSPPSPVQQWNSNGATFVLKTQSSVRSSFNPVPASTSTRPAPSRHSTPAVVPDLSAFAKMSESIAAQNALLLKLQSSMSFSGAPMVVTPETEGVIQRSSSPLSPSTRSANDRFEVLS